MQVSLKNNKNCHLLNSNPQGFLALDSNDFGGLSAY